MKRAMKRIAAIAIVSLVAASANAEELKGQDALDLLGKTDILFSRIANAEFGTNEQKIVEVVVFQKGKVWLCDIWVEGGPIVAFAYYQLRLSETDSEFMIDIYKENIADLEGRSNYECSQVTPYIMKADGTFE
ncbi:MAG: hypothetical protein OXB95_11395 [Rhodobacteraceae bacterium]|nr:hypothetical protein [Paracoccaceae bacterium]